MNARGFFPVAVPKARNNNFGFTLGGPVIIPKVYNGKNKTFFFTNLDWFKFRSGPLPGFRKHDARSTPSSAAISARC